jgi:APA family basic amino acid/polyamine antiporter
VTGLKKTLGLVGLSFYGVGLIVGAGIYSVIGSAAGEAGTALWLSFLVAAAAAFLTGLSYAELGTMFPRAAAEYVYLEHAMPAYRWIRFLVGFMMVAAASATGATVSLAFAGYLQTFVTLPAPLVAAGLLMAATALGIVGIREASWVNILFTTIEVAGLLLVITIGLPEASVGDLVAAPELGPILRGAGLIFFVYLGFEEIANLAEEAKDPGRDLPRAILVSLVVTTVLYVLVSVSVVALVTPERLAGSDSPLAEAVSGVSGRAAQAITIVALFATANTVLIALIAGSRMLFGMARSGDMPAILASVLSGRGSPWAASLAVLMLAAAILPMRTIGATASLSSLASLVAFVAVNVALVVLRYREPKRARPFRVPLAMGRFAVLPAAGALGALVLVVQFERAVYVAGALVMALGSVAYLATRRRSDAGGGR